MDEYIESPRLTLQVNGHTQACLASRKSSTELNRKKIFNPRQVANAEKFLFLNSRRDPTHPQNGLRKKPMKYVHSGKFYKACHSRQHS